MPPQRPRSFRPRSPTPVSFPPVTSAALPSPHTQTETAPSQDTAASSTLETPTHHANSPYDLSTEYHNNDPAATSPAPSQDEAPPAPRPEAPDRLIGTVIDDRYRIEARIARGGMATVYKAHDSRLDRHVALKIMYPHLAESQEFVTRFRREARAAAKLTHPGVVAVYDQGTTEGSSYLVMELVKGPNLPEGRALPGNHRPDSFRAIHRAPSGPDPPRCEARKCLAPQGQFGEGC